MESIRKKLEGVKDTRNGNYVEHSLADILIMIMFAVLCGLDTLEEIATYAKQHQSFFKQELNIQKIPSRATFGRILETVHAEEIGQIIIEILKERYGTQGNVIAVDGKAIRSTIKEGNIHRSLQILSAYVTASGVILGQKAIDEKTNEIPVLQELLDTLDVKDKVITADSMHCQRQTCKKIIENEGDYIFGLKANQANLHRDVALYLKNAEKTECTQVQTVEKNAGRYEKRICTKIHDISWLEGKAKWSGLKSVFSIRRIIEHKDKKSDETCYYISSLDVGAKDLMMFTREHWKIESLHWQLDVTFKEDVSRFQSENAHKTLNSLRKFALALHKNYVARNPKVARSLKSHMLACLINPAVLLQMIQTL